MPKRSSKAKSEDLNQIAHRVVAEATGEALPVLKEKNAAAVALGRQGGLKGGKARAAKLTAEERHNIAVKGASARWARKKP